ncbi:hypothetical protein UFOVP1454_2 [uncultured Caudovirales phage]|uniref:Uncharacterized protein n=1 Tax=uncultured Caudovirales phage TaxID=2100421 RepID=A0A6J5SIV6_9CAUD|nr:hypothetical protein UFOVP1454_2 [uncultured Caudovirales phage]
MAYSQKLKTSKPKYTTISLSSSTTTAEIDLEGGTLCALKLPELTSTTFTITWCEQSGGTFVTLKDWLGAYTTAGSAITFTIGATSLGGGTFPPALTAGLRFIKIVFDSSETADIIVVKRNID